MCICLKVSCHDLVRATNTSVCIIVLDVDFDFTRTYTATMTDCMHPGGYIAARTENW